MIKLLLQNTTGHFLHISVLHWEWSTGKKESIPVWECRSIDHAAFIAAIQSRMPVFPHLLDAEKQIKACSGSSMTIWFRVSPYIPLQQFGKQTDMSRKFQTSLWLRVDKWPSRAIPQAKSWGRQRAFPSNSHRHCHTEFLPRVCANGHCKPFQSNSQDSQAKRKNFRTVKDYSVLISKKTSQEVFLKESKKHSFMYSNQAIKSLAHWLLFRKQEIEDRPSPSFFI